MNNIKKITAATLPILMIGSMPVMALASTEPSEKEEVIYVMADASGEVKDIEAVNIFEGGSITDYGNYSDVKILNTNDSITQNGDIITFSSDADKIYYQGTMKNTAIPWNISIQYYLDGKRCSASELAGKSGALEIRFSVSKNEACTSNFYEDYALQASFTFDTDLCKNIISSDATVANVGSDKQLTYTILPGKGIDTVIRANVTDFEMDSAAINGVRLNLNIEVDDSELTDKVDEIVDVIGNLDDGASEVSNGTGKLYDATKTLNSKFGELNDGVGSLADGASDLYSGLSTITKKNSQLTSAAYTAFEGICTASSAALNAQLSANDMGTVTLTPSNYSSVLLGLLEKVDADAVYNEAYQKALQQVTEKVNAQADELYQEYINSQANSIYLEYVSSQADELYTQVAAQAVYDQLIQNGEYTEAQANAYLQSQEGQAAVAQAAAGMTQEQKTQILNAAVSQLTDEQRQQILQEAAASLTEEQKTQIRETYIQQMMASDDVTSQINNAAATVSTTAKQISELKGQLDNFKAFYQGLLDYTDAVSDAGSGAKSLKLNMDKLYSNTGKIKLSVGELSDSVKELYSGTKSLTNGTSEFVDKTEDIDTQISDEIDSMTSGISGGDDETVSFVSDKNTNVDSVQFVIKTAPIEKNETSVTDVAKDSQLSLWQKLIDLFKFK